MLIKATDLKKYYTIKKGVFSQEKNIVHAVDGVDIEIKEHETMGLVGESGCGKSSVGRLLIGLIKPTSGSVHFMGSNIVELKDNEMNKLRKDMQIIFQDPYASLNPRKTVKQILKRPFIVHSRVARANNTSVLSVSMKIRASSFVGSLNVLDFEPYSSPN